MIPCCIFSYREDSYEVVLAARSAAMAGLFPVFVIDDANRPISKEARNHLEQESHIVIQMKFDRSNGLRGLEAFKAILDIYETITAQTGTSHLVKIDSDTVLVRADSLREARDQNLDLFGWCSERYALHGTTYLISRDLVLQIREFINRWDGVPGYANFNLPEDLGIYRMAYLLHGNMKIEMVSPKGSLGVLWSWNEPSDYFSKYAERFSSISFGNRMDPDGNRISKVESYMIQSAFMDYLSKCQTSPTCYVLQPVA